MIYLKDIDMDNLFPILNLKLKEEDRHKVATNMFSLAEAYADKVSEPKAIYHNNDLVGFVMYDYNEIKQTASITRLMIDYHYQRKGYAYEAMQKVIDLLKQKNGISTIRISYHPHNEKARKLYFKLGFSEISDKSNGETVAIIKI